MSTGRLKGWKTIAAHIGRSERTARGYSSRPSDPLPVAVFGDTGRIEADARALDEWMERQLRPRTVEAQS